MAGSELFEPSLRAYVAYVVGFCIRYFAIAGGIFLMAHVVFRRRWLAYRIQSAVPSLAQVAFEIRWSILSAACTALSTLVIYQLVRDGHASMYFVVADFGWLYLWLSSLLCVVGYDTWGYWQHRLLHTPWLFRHVHAVHHRVRNPTAFAAFTHHPIETFMGNLYFILLIVAVPIHPLALAAAGVYMFVTGILLHSGYEFFPRGFTQRRLVGWVNTSTYHNMHHQYVTGNYGTWFVYWDYLMDTNHRDYHRRFDAIKGRSAKGRSVLASRVVKTSDIRRRAA
jgi:lathosterol oxidase